MSSYMYSQDTSPVCGELRFPQLFIDLRIWIKLVSYVFEAVDNMNEQYLTFCVQYKLLEVLFSVAYCHHVRVEYWLEKKIYDFAIFWF